jgi:glycosyltransferase involved in cell wall biosynthesis
MKSTVYINGRFLTSRLSGVQRSAYELVKALDNVISKDPDKYKTLSFKLIYSGKIINAIELKCIQLYNKGVLKGNLWEQLELPLYTAGSLLVNLCSIAPLIKSKQLVLIHDASFFVNKDFFSKSFRAWYQTAIPVLGKISRHIVTVSNFSKNELVKYARIKPNKITVIPNSADHILRFKDPDDQFKEKINLLKPYCLAVSNLGANKNFHGLAKALALIDFKKYTMVIAGGGLSALKNEPAADNATYLGYVSDEELKYLYENASLFIFPSFYEGFGIPPLEAMISGCPVIASNTTSIPEVCGDACAYFDPKDAMDMAANINALVNDSERLAQLKIKGYERAAMYSWEHSSRLLSDVITKYCE